MKITIAALLLVLAIPAFATGNKNKDQEQEQDQKQYQGQEQSQSTVVNIGGGTDAQGNAAPLATAQGGSLTFNEAKRPDDITIRNTASARVPNLVATSPCFYSWSAGIGIAGANLGGGKAKRDEECDKRELARMIAGFGYTDIAMAIACKTEAAIETIGELCAGMVTSTDMVASLTAENVRLRQQIETEKLNCNDSNNRVFEACQQGK